jgi:penicillin-insensitive murein endopeptidase
LDEITFAPESDTRLLSVFVRWQSCIAGIAGAGLIGLAAIGAGSLAGPRTAGAQERLGARDAALLSRAAVRASASAGSAGAAAAGTRREPGGSASDGEGAITAERIDGERPARERHSTSVGRHNRGRLDGGRALVSSEHVRLKRPDGDGHHGTDELVDLLERSAASVAEQFPGARLTVGDISRRRGGAFRPHRSHRSGRDVDVGFYLLDGEGGLAQYDRFLDVLPDGALRRGQLGAGESWRFCDARNWALISALLGQDEVPVQYIFIARWLKHRLLEHARSIGAPAEVIARAEVVLDQPRRGGRHEDHFHMRIYCPAGDRPRCHDDPPWHDWVARPTAEEIAASRDADRARVATSRRSRRARADRATRARRRSARSVAASAAVGQAAAGGGATTIVLADAPPASGASEPEATPGG